MAWCRDMELNAYLEYQSNQEWLDFACEWCGCVFDNEDELIPAEKYSDVIECPVCEHTRGLTSLAIVEKYHARAEVLGAQ